MNILKSKITKVLFLLCLLADKLFAYDYFYAEDYFEDGQFLYEELNNAYTPKVIYEAYVQFPDIIKQGIKEKKIDVNKVYETDGTLLILLAKQGKDPKSFEFLQFIIENGADPNAKVDGITALEYAKKLLKTFPSDDLTETIAILSALGKNDSSDDSLTDITLTEALLMGNVELSKKLLAELSDINQPDEEGHYPINNAIRSKNPEVLKLVLARKPDLTKVDKGYEYAPLQRAVIARDKEMVKLLIDAGADINQQNFDSLYHYYDSPLYSAVGNEVLRKEFQQI